MLPLLPIGARTYENLRHSAMHYLAAAQGLHATRHRVRSYLGIQLLLPSLLYMPVADDHFDLASKGEINGCDLSITGVNNDVPRLPISLLLANLQQDFDM